MEEQITLNHTYLIRFGTSDIVNSITILQITEKAYYIRWNRENESTFTWELKEVFERNWTIVEDITDFNVTIPDKKIDVKTKLVRCHICHGMGNIPDPNSTAGSKLCPLCMGGKMIPEVTDITY